MAALHPTRDVDAGLTLIEMLVALALFALVGLASFATLDAIITSRTRTEGRLEAVSAIDRAFLIFGRDLQQAAPGTVTGDGEALAITVGQRVLLWSETEGALIRQQSNLLENSDGVEQVILTDLADVRMRYLDSERVWRDSWSIEDSSADSLRLIGVEIGFSATGTPGPVHKIVALVETAP